MSENILIAIAWPYANAEIHVGNITGSHLPGDIVARYHRLKGNKVLMVSGTDSHGTPVTIAPIKKANRWRKSTKIPRHLPGVFQGYGITYDLFTTTHTENHFKVSQAIFLALQRERLLFTQKSLQWYSPSANKFLPDRYVEGTCYICGYEGARSDQCDNCGNVLEPEKLINPRQDRRRGARTARDRAFLPRPLQAGAGRQGVPARARRPHARYGLGESLRKIEAEGLKPRPITRDLDWGIPVPVEGWTERASASTSGSRPSSATSPLRSSGAGRVVKVRTQKEAWREWWANPRPASSTSSARTTSSSTPPCGRPADGRGASSSLKFSAEKRGCR
jgi:methionyl-tRNA synthetase